MSDADIFSLGFEVDTSALGQGKAMAEAFAKALYDVQKAMQAEEAAAKKAAEAERKKAEDTRRAAEEASRASDPNGILASILEKVGGNAKGVSEQIGGLTEGFIEMGQSLGGGGGGLLSILQSLSDHLGSFGSSLGGVTGGALALGAGVVGAAAALGTLVVATAHQQEQFTMLEARLKNIYGSASIAADTFRDLTELAQKNGIAIDGTAESFLRLARNNEAIGLTRQQMLQLTDSVQKLGRISGASQGELAGGLMQFSQALAAGRLNGDELRSIMENLPELTKRIADGLGVSVGQLRAMGAEGQLTSEKVVGALRSQIDEINKDFEGLPDTSEQAFTRVGNAWDKLMANMGKSMGSSGLLTGLGNAAAGVIDAAADAIAPETDMDRYKRLGQLRSDIYGFRQSGGIFDRIRAQTFSDTYKMEGGDALYFQLREKIANDQAAAAAKDAAGAGRAPFDAAAPIAQDLDKQSGDIQKITENINTLQKAYDAFQARPDLFEPQEVESLKRFPELVAALRIQLEGAKTPLNEYISTTQKMADNIAKYGAGGAASLADEASKLVESAAKAGVLVTQSEALSAVTARRTVETNRAAAAMDAEIAASKRQKDAIEMGAQAQIEAEVATKTLAYQMQTFGTVVDGPARAAIERYADKLRELLQIQRDTADAQRAYNAEIQIGIERQISAAIRAGATAGEIAKLRADLQSGLRFGDAMASGASSVRVGGAQIPSDLQGYFDQASKATGIPVALLAAVAQQESNLGANVGNGPARGIMQILPSTARDPGMGVAPMSVMSLDDPGQNIMFGAQYLAGIARSMGLDINNPADVRKLLRRYNGSDGPGGDVNYDSAVLGRLPQGAQASAAEAQLTAEKAAQQAAQRIAALEKEAAALRAQAGAKTTTEAQRIAREEQVRKAGEAGQTPEERKALEDAMRAKLAAQDDAKVADRLRAIEDETKLMERQAQLAKLPAKEREIELRVLEEVNRQKAAGIQLDAAQIDAIRANITKQIADQDFADKAKEQADKFKGVWDSAAQSIGSALESALSQALNNGKVEADQILKGLIADITMAIFRAYVTQPLVQGIQGLIGAQGFVSDAAGTRVGYAHGGVLAFASGGVVSSPTLFPMARGAGLMGEAGPEAVLPLKRGSDGKLGVAQGGGGGISVVVNDMRTAPGAEPVEVQEQQGPDGQRMLQVMVRDEVRKQVRNGELDKEMRSSFGVQRQLTRR